MKNFKILSIIIVIALCVSLMVACGNKDNGGNTTDTTAQSTEAAAPENTDNATEGNADVTEGADATEGNSDVASGNSTEASSGAESEAGSENESTNNSGNESTTDSSSEESSNAPEVTVEPDITMTFSESGCEISDTSAVSVSGKIYTITKAGTYVISGTMADGQIRVDIQKTEKATLLLNNFTGSCSDSAVIYVMNADEVYIDMEKDSVNTLTDASSYVFENPADDKPNACIYSSDDLTIKGGGRLNVYANYNNGIGCKNDIDIKNGTVSVKAVKNAIKGNDSVTLRGDAEVIITGAKDGIKTDNVDRADKGYVEITEMAKVVVTCSDDAIQATQKVVITEEARVTVVAASSAVNCDGKAEVADGSLIIQ